MKKWKALRGAIGVVLGLVFVILILRISLFGAMDTMPPMEEVVAASGGFGWLIGILYWIMQRTWLLIVLTVLLIAATLFCQIMEIREEGFHPIKMVTSIVSSLISLGALIYLLILIYR